MFFSAAKDKAVVRERISCYDSGVKLNSYRSDLAWASLLPWSWREGPFRNSGRNPMTLPVIRK